MKGTVEIYGITPEGSEDLVFQGPNMSVVGFAEHITDFLTTPSSVKYPLATNSNILDASNYEIQAFSMSKQKDNFTKDQHSYKTTNFLSNPEFNALEFSSVWATPFNFNKWAITTDGSAYAWGGYSPYYDGMVSGTPSGLGFTKVAGGDSHAMILNTDGSAYSWGTVKFPDYYDVVSKTPTGTGHLDIACGFFHSLILSSDGSLSSWGAETNCALQGDVRCGVIADTPSSVGFTKVAAGSYHSLALDSNGSVSSWGTNYYAVISDTPQESGFTQIAGGQFHSYALRADGSIAAWGRDAEGQVSLTPTETGFIKVAAGRWHGLALRSDGTIVSWGFNGWWSTGGPVSKTPTSSRHRDIAASYYNRSLAVRYSGSIANWGADLGYDEGAPQDIGTSGGWELINANVSGDIVVGPTIDSSGYLITSELSSGSLAQSIDFSGGNLAFNAPYFSGTEFTFSVDLKFNKDDPPVTAAGAIANGSDYSGYSHVELRLNGNSPRTSIRWDSSGQAHLHNNSYTKWDGGIKKLSDDWYRVFVTGYNSGRGKSLSAIIYPSIGDAGVDSNIPPTTGMAGSIYISRPQLELGRVPTSFVPSTSSLEVSSNRDDKIAYSLLNETLPFGQVITGIIGQPNIQVFNYIVTKDSGGKSLSATYHPDIRYRDIDKGVSAYLPETSSIKRVNYIDRSLTPGARTPVEEALGIEFTKGQIPAALGLSSNLHLSSFRSDWSYTSSYIPAIGRHIAYLGSYVSKKGSSAPLRPMITYVSAYDIIGLENPLYSQGLAMGIEGASGIDKYGYWTLSANGKAVSDVISPQVSRFYKEASLGFSSTGEITYCVRIGNVAAPNPEADGERDEEDEAEFAQKDSPLLNIFGGVDTLGLWGLDLAAIKENSISNYPPYRELVDTSSTFVEPIRKYKLFNKINLSDNLVKCEGISSLRGLVGFYKAFELRWRISFR